jgi:hypothetical protein
MYSVVDTLLTDSCGENVIRKTLCTLLWLRPSTHATVHCGAVCFPSCEGEDLPTSEGGILLRGDEYVKDE